VRGRPGVLAGALALGGLFFGALPWVLEIDESLGLGAMFTQRGPLAAPNSVVVVSITGEAAAEIGQGTEVDEWPRELHATLIDSLKAGGAAAVAFDMTFLERRAPESDRRLAEAIAAAGNVLLAERIAERTVVPLGGGGTALVERREPPLPEFDAAALGTAPFVLPVVPVRVGQFWTFGLDADATPSLPALALQAYLRPHYVELTDLVESARPGATTAWPVAASLAHDLDEAMRRMRTLFERDARLARDVRALLDERRAGGGTATDPLRVLLDLYSGPGSRHTNYYGPSRTIRTIPYDRALEPDGLEVSGKMVFVGFAETRQPDQQDDFYSIFSQRSGVNLSGVEVGATAFANLLEGRAVRMLPMLWQLLVVLVVGVVAAAVVARRSMRHAAVAALTGAVLYAGSAYYFFATQDLWLPLVVPLAQWAGAFGVVLWWHYRLLGVQREHVHKALGYYVPAALARRIVEESVAIGADDRLLHGTCLFTDAEQYTAVAETLRPEELGALMNDYYAALFRVVKAHGGEISDTAGDSMVAIWASVQPDVAARARARRAAVAVLDAVADFNRAHPGRELPTRVGLESGELLLGNIGAEQRYEYRAIGDIVNTASRIQELNRVLGTRVLISHTTLVDAVAPAVRDVGSFVVRGKRLPVHVFEPLAAASAALDAVALERFAAGMAAFRAGSWREARREFGAALERAPGDGPSSYYLALAGRYETQAPDRWSGAVELAEK
jgi:adenylate cyclase